MGQFLPTGGHRAVVFKSALAEVSSKQHGVCDRDLYITIGKRLQPTAMLYLAALLCRVFYFRCPKCRNASEANTTLRFSKLPCAARSAEVPYKRQNRATKLLVQNYIIEVFGMCRDVYVIPSYH